MKFLGILLFLLASNLPAGANAEPLVDQPSRTKLRGIQQAASELRERAAANPRPFLAEGFSKETIASVAHDLAQSRMWDKAATRCGKAEARQVEKTEVCTVSRMSADRFFHGHCYSKFTCVESRNDEAAPDVILRELRDAVRSNGGLRLPVAEGDGHELARENCPSRRYCTRDRDCNPELATCYRGCCYHYNR